MKASYYVVAGEHCEGHPMGESEDAVPSDHLKGTMKYGRFKEAHPTVAEVTGKNYNNVELSIFGGLLTFGGVLSEDKRKVTFWGFCNELDSFSWMSVEDFRAYKESYGVAIDAIPHHYKIQPENKGRLLWISGAPGIGKSTTGQVLSRNSDWVYYEADAFLQMVNPFLPSDADEPTMAQFKQKPLMGISQERINRIKKGLKVFVAIGKGETYDMKDLEMFYNEICKNIRME